MCAHIRLEPICPSLQQVFCFDAAVRVVGWVDSDAADMNIERALLLDSKDCSLFLYSGTPEIRCLGCWTELILILKVQWQTCTRQWDRRSKWSGNNSVLFPPRLE